MSGTVYHVTATRVGRWWALECVEHPAATSQVTRLEKAQDMMREAIAFVADVPQDSFDVMVTPVLPDEYAVQAGAAERSRDAARAANTQAATHARCAAHVLSDAGLTVRDIGTVMGVSHQRAAQLLAAAPRETVNG